MTQITLGGETVVLLAERALWWPRERTLFVADPHFGKAAAFRTFGVPVPEAVNRATVARLAALSLRLDAQHIVFLGDFIHHRSGWSSDTIEPLKVWRADQRSILVTLVRGNHDRHGGDPPAELVIRCVNAPHRLAPFILFHEPGDGARGAGFGLAGHLHPAVFLTGRRNERARLRCFWLRTHQMILPAFGEFTGSMMIDPTAGECVFAVVQETVILLPPRG